MIGVDSRPRVSSFGQAAARIFELSLGQMLRSRRIVFLGILAGTPVILALAVRLLSATGVVAVFEVKGAPVTAPAIFGILIWVLFLRFMVPVLAVFYGTALIADEVEDRTITYLFSRPIPRAALIAGKFLAYLACTWLVVLPAAIVTYFILLPLPSLAPNFNLLMFDLVILALGLAVYGALLTWVGTALKRPLVVGLVFTLAWEPVALLLPGYLNRLTVAYYLQGLVPHTMPPDAPAGLLQFALRDVPPTGVALFWLFFALVAFLAVAMRTISRREYVLEQ